MRANRPIFLLFFLVITTCVIAQKNEVGVGLGAVSYKGDLAAKYQLLEQRLGLNVLYRSNLSDDISLRFSLLVGSLSGSEKRDDVFSENRNSPSFKVPFFETSAVLEYHFLDFRHKSSTVKWSPYLMGGIGVINFGYVSNSTLKLTQPAIPIGLGIKHLIGKRFNYAVEFGARKTFSDLIDNVSDINQGSTPEFGGNFNNSDWYHYFNISLSYVLYKIECKYQYVPHKYRK